MSLQAEWQPPGLLERAPSVRSEAEALELLGSGWESRRDHQGELVYQSLLSRVGFLSLRVLDWVLVESPRSAHSLFANPVLEPTLGEYLARRGMEGFRTGFQVEDDTVALPFAELVREACRQGYIPFDSEKERWLRQAALEAEQPAQGREARLHRRMQAAAAVASCPDAPREVLAQLLDTFEGEIGKKRAYAALLTPFLENPQADLALWRRLAEWGKFYPHLRVALSRKEAARVDEPIRLLLAEDVGRESIVVALSLDDREDSRAWLRELVRHRPRLAVEVLEHPECSVTRGLEREDWVEMLASPHAPLRLVAIQQQARQGEGLDTEEKVSVARGTGRGR